MVMKVKGKIEELFQIEETADNSMQCMFLNWILLL